MQRLTMLIDGAAVDTTERDPVVDPSTGEAFATCPRATTEHVERAALAAERAFPRWSEHASLRRTSLSACAAAPHKDGTDARLFSN